MKLPVVIRTTFYALLIGCMYSCANVQAPTGGAKDIEAPKLITSSPANKEIQFQGSQVRLTFDEPIEIVNLKNNLLISPYLETEYSYKVNRNILTINFDKSFPENSTITLNFGNAVKDMTEGNITPNLQLTFSTGPVLDSLSISGTVTEMLSNKAPENTVVTLYAAEDTMTVTKHKPLYYTKTNKEGNYQLSNIKGGRYKIFAYDDQNNNLKYDEQTEKIAFLEKPLALEASIQNLDLKLVKQDERPLKLLRKNQVGENVEIEYNKNIEQAKVIALKTNKPITTLVATGGNKAVIYNELQTFDSLDVKITATDSLGIVAEDTTKILFKTPKADDIRIANISSQPERGGQLGEDFTIELSSNEPIKSFNKQKVKIIADSTDLIKDYRVQQELTAVKLGGQVLNKKQLEVIIDSAAFETITGKFNKNDTLSFQIGRETNRGDISGRITTKHANFIIELVKEDFSVEKRIKNTADYRFTNVQPQKYFLRVIIDRNGNGQWDPGRFSKGIIPEEIIFYKEPIEVRANWEIEGINLEIQ